MIKNVYFLGIGGIGMSALARYYHHAGAFVAGYDLTQTHLTDLLQKEGMDIHFEDDPERIPKQVIRDKAHTLVIYTPPFLPTTKNIVGSAQRIRYYKTFCLLGTYCRKAPTLAVAGTHGKLLLRPLLTYCNMRNGLYCLFGGTPGITIPTCS